MTPEDELTARRDRRENTRVDPANARSWLLLSALRADDFDAAQLSRADQLVLDCEDAVDESRKDEARRLVLDWFRTGGRAWVRVNERGAAAWADDMTAFRDAEGLCGVILAKCESPDQVVDTVQRLGGHVPVVPLVESALGIEDAVRIARAPGAFRLAFGSGDYRRDTGAANEPLAMAYPRSRLVNASRIGELPGPIDGPTVGSSHPLLREQSGDAVAMGMTGRICLDLEQPAVINEVLSPAPADVAWAQDFLAEFEASGSVIRDGSDKPRLARARLISERARLFRVEPS
ncbi:CoA ester lyase [Isoptericola sp. b408]|uniref:HpcH/HpaI aldolase/citrate lyase family protein n=1 Tax=unclassified Isoptericola TaxID=2623355 RepID=UPI003510CB54